MTAVLPASERDYLVEELDHMSLFPVTVGYVTGALGRDVDALTEAASSAGRPDLVAWLRRGPVPSSWCMRRYPNVATNR